MIRNEHDNLNTQEAVKATEERVTRVSSAVRTALKNANVSITSVCNVIGADNKDGCCVMIRASCISNAEIARSVVVKEMKRILVGERELNLLNDKTYRKIKRERNLYFIFVVMYTDGTYRYY